MHDNAIAVPPAPFLVRIAAMIYELLLVTAVVFVASFVSVLNVVDLHVPWQMFLYRLYLLGMLFAYFSAFWLRSGQTLAMKTWRIRLVSQSGGPLSFKQAALRFTITLFSLSGLLLGGAVFWWVLSGNSLMPFKQTAMYISLALLGLLLAAVDFCWPLFDRDRQFLHDRIAGTRLIRVPRKA
jgi:uncharacterized RDD family membrane protein YckC